MLRIVCVFSQDTGVRDVQISGKIAPLLLFAHTKSGILRRLSALRIFTLQRKTTDQVIYCGKCTQAAIDADYPRHTSPLRPTKSVRRRGLFLSAIFRFRNVLDGSTPTIRSRRAGCTPRRLQKYTLPPNAAPDMGVTSAQSRARGASVSGARDGLGDGVDSIFRSASRVHFSSSDKNARGKGKPLPQVRAHDTIPL